MTEKYEYFSTVPRTFVQDCSLELSIHFNRCTDALFLGHRIAHTANLKTNFEY